MMNDIVDKAEKENRVMTWPGAWHLVSGALTPPFIKQISARRNSLPTSASDGTQ